MRTATVSGIFRVCSSGSAIWWSVDGRRYRVLARIEDGVHTTALPTPGRVLVRARQPIPGEPAPVNAVTLAGPDAAVVELAAARGA